MKQLPKVLTWAFAAATILAASQPLGGCATNQEISGGAQTASGKKKGNRSTSHGSGDDKAGGVLSANVGDDKVLAIDYPTFRLNGTGLTHCDDGSNYGPYVVNARFELSADETSSTSKTESFVCTCFNPNDHAISSSCQDRNTPVADKTSAFARLSPDEIAAFKAAPNAAYVNYLIYASGVTRTDGVNLKFDPPLPTGVWAGDANRFKDDDDTASHIWTSSVTGTASMTVHVTAAKITQDEHSVTVKLVVTIDQAGQDYSLYEKLPLARETTYVIDTDTKALKTIRTVSYHRSTSSHCHDNVQTEMNLTACDMTAGGKTTSLGCTFGQ